MNEDVGHSSVIAFLERGCLRHIAMLKMLSLYGPDVQSHYLNDARGDGALLLLPTTASPFDRKAYAQCQYVVMFSATSRPATQGLLDLVPRGVGLVFKLLHDADRKTVERIFPLRRVVGVLSLTAPPGAHFEPAPDVFLGRQVDPRCYELFAAQGHPPEEVNAHFASADARCSVLYQDDVAACACFTYRNYGNVYEVSSVYTRPEFRRRGLAQRVVQTALHDLLSRGHTPRYQAHEHNTASIALAEGIGLRPFVTMEHWVTIGSLPADGR